MGVHAPSVTDMLKRMAGKKLVTYQKSKGFKLSEKGKKVAVGIIRNHRLWEVFLVDKLGFRWDEVHDLAEQLEHIHSEDLVIQYQMQMVSYPNQNLFYFLLLKLVKKGPLLVLQIILRFF